MNTTIAGYYIDELAHWMRLIGFYNREITELEHKLAEVIQRNTIPHIAEKVEAQQSSLNQVSAKFETLYTLIEKQHAVLKTDHMLIDNSLIDEDTNKRQNELRQQMEQAEKFYLEVKYACYQFLSESLKKHQ
jgi:uncharacterized coiled-coil protein SlyX